MQGDNTLDEMDLCCSESTANISPTYPSDGRQSQLEDFCTMEYRVLSPDDAWRELQWLLSTELPANPHAVSERQRIVDTLCVAAERMRTSFATKSLAVSLLDRFLASNPNLDGQLVCLVAVGCLSIAAKFEEVDFPIHLFRCELSLLWDLRPQPSDLPRVELAIMSALGWKIQSVTAATVLDTLACMLDFQACMQDVDKGKQLHIVRESCKLILAKALRDPCFLEYRPSSLATAAVLIVLNELVDDQAIFPCFDNALQNLFSAPHVAEVRACIARIEETLLNDSFPCLRSCRVELASEGGLAKVFQQKAPSSVNTTPSSVLQSAQALAVPCPGSGS